MALQVCVGDEPLALGLGREMGMKRRQPRCDGARITFSHARPTGILYKMRDARGLRRARDLLLCLTYVFESPVSVTSLVSSSASLWWGTALHRWGRAVCTRLAALPLSRLACAPSRARDESR